MIIPTAHFGPLEVSRKDMVEFLAPLPPFVGLFRYVLVSREEEHPFVWLQSVEQAALALPLAPHRAVSDEPPLLPPPVRHELGLLPDERPEVYVIISPALQAEQTTMNLLAPIYICRRTRRALQVICQDDAALARVPLLPLQAQSRTA